MNTTNEYDKPLTLPEILEELSNHCFDITGKRSTIKVYLPPEVLGKFSQSFQPKEKIILSGNIENPTIKLSHYHITNGIVELFSTSESS